MNYGVEISEYQGKTIGVYGGKFLPFHEGHLNCIMMAQSLVDILFVVVGYDHTYEQELCRNTRFKWVSQRVRERWITKELKDFPNIRVLAHYERRSDDYMNDPTVMYSNKELIKKVGGKVDFVFSSEVIYEEYFEKYIPGAKHIVLDELRMDADISATDIRNYGVYNQWEYLPKSVQEYYNKRVAICGIESAGKTHLVKMLSRHFQTNSVKEYGRTYYEDIGGFGDIDEPTDYQEIAVGHCHLMNEAVKESNKVLIVDTDLVYTQYFHARSHNNNYDILLDGIIQCKVEKIDTYIYIEPHNYHELDGTRRPVEERLRAENNLYLKSLYRHYGIDLIIVDEVDRLARFEKCVRAIEGALK